ncbi:MAG: glycine cleavage system aminomethyltransferase GcvT [Magnetococcales bacterium]|nr:glycine cleavage system aminomethyltransferase GcvT [Magnetococcales bacterium]
MQLTALHDRHRSLGAKMMDFSGWDMPLHYGSQVKEHQAVRTGCGLFDVSHMGVIDLQGEGSLSLLQRILACDVARLPIVEPGQAGSALYGLMLNDRGNIADDLIVYRLASDFFSLVVNAGTRQKDLAWIRAHAITFGVNVQERGDLSILAVQGPKARESLAHALPRSLLEKVTNLPAFHFFEQDEWRVARTGYTGEDGFELMIPSEWSERVWNGLLRADESTPIGLGARDTLRLEAGLNLYGSDMDAKHHPLESGVGWTVHWEPSERDFIGRQALELIRYQPDLKKRVGLFLPGNGVLRNYQRVIFNGREVGEITSGGYSPTLGKGIALARVDGELKIGTTCQVEIRGRLLPVQMVRPPFVKNGRSLLTV